MRRVHELLSVCRARFLLWHRERTSLERKFLYGLAGGVFFGSLWGFFLAPPSDFKTPRVIAIEEGAPLVAIAQTLHEEGAVRSPRALVILVELFGGIAGARSGAYFFPAPQSALTVALRLTNGSYDLTPVKVTLPEGSTVLEMSRILKEKLELFDEQSFIRLAEGKEGYLFPDTYYFLPGESPETVVGALEKNFSEQIVSLEEAIASFGKPIRDVVIMASLLEEEARTMETRRIIAGILWKRIAIGMPLQVDAVFPYILGKNTYEVTREDLAFDSPYNTYKYKGLPAGAISNPGLGSIRAALTPIHTPYLYYLSDRAGRMYYSATFEEHVRAKELYLNRR